MPKMILPYDYTLRGKSGRSVEFVAGEPTYVVPELQVEAEAIGAVPESDDQAAADQAAADQAAADQAAADQAAADQAAAAAQ